MKRALIAAALLTLVAAPARAHRLDEYLQGTLITIERTRVQLEITLTSGVAVFPAVFAAIDRDGDGVISQAEGRAYADRVLGNIALGIDDEKLSPHFVSAQFPSVAELKEGQGAIRLVFAADVDSGGSERRLTFQNHHEPRISVYQVNALVPRDRDIHIVEQKRNDTQSLYELDYTQPGIRKDVEGMAPAIAGLAAAAYFAVRRRMRAA